MDTVLERPVAVKLLAEHLADDEDFVARFRREALAAARLQHPNIVQVFDSGQDPRAAATTSSWSSSTAPRARTCCASTSSSRSTRPSASCATPATAWTTRTARAWCTATSSPATCSIADETGATKLADFGIAKAAEQTRITQVGSVLGTAAYLSPEQARGDEAGPASDIYSLGVCAYQFLTGRLPHEYSSLTELALKQQQDSVEPITALRPEVPRELDQAIRLCLEREPEMRYGSALDLARALEAGASGETTDATRALAAGRRSGRHPPLRCARRRSATTRRRRAAAAARPTPRPLRAPARRAQARPRRARWRGFLALLAIAVVAVALADPASSASC